jgi:hypothetical protein
MEVQIVLRPDTFQGNHRQPHRNHPNRLAVAPVHHMEKRPRELRRGGFSHRFLGPTHPEFEEQVGHEKNETLTRQDGPQEDGEVKGRGQRPGKEYEDPDPSGEESDCFKDFCADQALGKAIHLPCGITSR